MGTLTTSEIAEAIKEVSKQYDWKITGGVARIAAEKIKQLMEEKVDERHAMTKGKHGCCAAFKAAQESGTDNEGYGALLHDLDGRWSMGCDLPSIDYCAWCGTAVAKIEELTNARAGVVASTK